MKKKLKEHKLIWLYEYELENGILMKAKSITALTIFQSWKHEYYKHNSAGNPNWILHYIYRKDASQSDVYPK